MADHPATVGRLRIAWETVAEPRARRGRGQVIDYGWFDSPFDDMLILCQAEDLVGLAFRGDGTRAEVFRSMADRWPMATFRASPDALDGRAATLCRTGEARIRLAGTERQLQVWSELLAIPKGETRSYGDLARNLGTPRGAQWVGQANGANPIAWLVPCHRVIGNDGGIAGYAWGTTLKRAMLEAEGVRIEPT